MWRGVITAPRLLHYDVMLPSGHSNQTKTVLSEA